MQNTNMYNDYVKIQKQLHVIIGKSRNDKRVV